LVSLNKTHPPKITKFTNQQWFQAIGSDFRPIHPARSSQWEFFIRLLNFLRKQSAVFQCFFLGGRMNLRKVCECFSKNDNIVDFKDIFSPFFEIKMLN